jgi:hypothetical protein
MKFGTQMKGVKVETLNFFGARKIPGGYRMELQRKNFTCGLWPINDTVMYQIMLAPIYAHFLFTFKIFS